MATPPTSSLRVVTAVDCGRSPTPMAGVLANTLAQAAGKRLHNLPLAEPQLRS